MNIYHKVQSSNIYNIEWKKLATWLLPVNLRRKKLQAFVYALLAPVNDLHTRFLSYVKNVDYRLKINYQVCYLEAALNDRFDYVDRRIQIVRARQYDPFPIYLKPENKPVVLSKKGEGSGTILYSKQQTGQFTVDFIIKVPASVAFDLNELTAFVSFHIVQSRTFQVQTY